MRVMLYHYDKKYKAGDRITIETDSKKYLDQAKKDYASRRKNKKIKKKPS
jgi:ribonuclease HI